MMPRTAGFVAAMLGCAVCLDGAWAGPIRGDFFVSAKVADVLGSPNTSLNEYEGERIVIPAELRAPGSLAEATVRDPETGHDYLVYTFRTAIPDPQPVAGRTAAQIGVAFEVFEPGPDGETVVEAQAALSFNDVISFEQDTTDGVAVQLALSMPVHGVFSGLGVGDAVTGRAFQRITPQDAIDVAGTIQFQQRFFEARYFDDDGQPGVRVCHASNLDTLDLLLDFGVCDEEGELAFSLGGSSTYFGENFLFELGWEAQLTCGSLGCQPGIRIDFDETFAPSFRAGPFQAELPISSASGLFGAQANGSDEVPEPESLALLALALLGLGALRRRRVV